MRAIKNMPSVGVEDTSRIPTQAIWGPMRVTSIDDGTLEGWHFWDDFTNFPTLDEADVTDTKYASFGDGGTNIRQGAANELGEVVISNDGDNEEGWITTGGNIGGMASFELQATRIPYTVAFECRQKIDTLVENGWFVGFAEEGLAAANTMVDTDGIMADKDYIGFWTEEHASAPVVDFVYRKESGTAITIVSAGHTWAADTYVKLGFVYNYLNSHKKQIKVYFNGVLSASFVTKAQIDNTTDFPGGEEMALLFGGKNGEAFTNFSSLDWWKAALIVN